MSNEQLRNDMLQSMRRLASSVSVVTAIDDGEKYAMAATSVTSLSMNPPSLLVCVNKTTGMHQALDNGGDFAINVLSNDQQEVSAACGGKLTGEERFTVGNWTETSAGLPYLKDAQSVVVLEQDGRYEYGSHTIFIGKVKEIKNSEKVNPLLYVDGRYTTAAEAAEA